MSATSCGRRLGVQSAGWQRSLGHSCPNQPAGGLQTQHVMPTAGPGQYFWGPLCEPQSEGLPFLRKMGVCEFGSLSAHT